MKKIFIDTNMFLNLYRSNLKKDISTMLKLIYDNKKYFITTEQSINEFKRNRYSTIEGVLKEFRNKTQIDNGYSSFIRSLKSFGNYEKSIKKLLQDKKAVLDEIETMMYNKNNDAIYKKFVALCKLTATIPINDHIIRLAEIRKLSGNPPTSDKYTCDDEIIWESLLDYGRNNANDLVMFQKMAHIEKTKISLLMNTRKLSEAIWK